MHYNVFCNTLNVVAMNYNHINNAKCDNELISVIMLSPVTVIQHYNAL